MRTIKDIDLNAKRVLIRVDFNVPLDGKQRISDDTRIKAVIPTIRYALAAGAKLILASHLGRPKGQIVPEMSMAPVAQRLAELLEQPVTMAVDSVGAAVEQTVALMAPGEVVLLENLRFHAQEQQNEDDYGRALAALCDVYVNDAFAVSHRVNASVAAITRHAPVAVAGLLLQRELEYFDRAMRDPRRPLAAIVGGAKISSKLAAIDNMLDRVDKLLVGGAMANTFLTSLGHDMQGSKIEPERVEAAADIVKRAAQSGVKLYLPVDGVVAGRFDAQAPIRTVPVQEIPVDWMMLDIGPATALLYAQALYDAKTIVWNGPMGVFEMDAFSRGTFAMVNTVANAHALTIVGGGDTDVALHRAGEAQRIDYISTGGGAFLKLLEGATLPAVAALVENRP